MDFILDLLKAPFVWGLLLGLLIAFFTWKSGFSSRRVLRKEVERIQSESQELQRHLNTHLKVQAEGTGSLQEQLDELRKQNENLRVNIASLQQKPGRAELRHLQIMENAVGLMREQAPGFAQAWEAAVRQAEHDHAEGEGGLKKLVRRVLPAISTSAHPPVEINEEEKEKAKDA
ncbi:MAG: hypothetical protein ACSHYF_02170 [Verrucomicrobiaceae bacterium]